MLRPELSAPRTLIADDQPDVLEALHLLLKREGYQIEAVNSPKAVLERLRDREYDVLLMDLNYALDTTSGQEGLDLLASVQKLDRTLPVVVMTAWGSIKLAVEAMQRGAADFVENPGTIRSCFRLCARKSRPRNERRTARPANRAKSRPPAPRSGACCRARSRNFRDTESRPRGVRPGPSAAIIWTCCGWIEPPGAVRGRCDRQGRARGAADVQRAGGGACAGRRDAPHRRALRAHQPDRRGERGQRQVHHVLLRRAG
jgi:FixJ family two-component response regulator